MAKKCSKVVIIGLVAGLIVTSCLTVPEGQLSPNASQSVISIRRANYPIEKRKSMEVYINGRKENKKLENGQQGQFLVKNGLTQIQVRVGKHQSQTMIFECSSEVVEFLASFEGDTGFLGFGGDLELFLTQISGGTRSANSNTKTDTAGPVINISVDNSSSNSANSSGNTNNQ